MCPTGIDQHSCVQYQEQEIGYCPTLTWPPCLITMCIPLLPRCPSTAHTCIAQERLIWMRWEFGLVKLRSVQRDALVQYVRAALSNFYRQLVCLGASSAGVDCGLNIEGVESLKGRISRPLYSQTLPLHVTPSLLSSYPCSHQH